MTISKRLCTTVEIAFFLNATGCQTPPQPSNDGVDASSRYDVRDASELDTSQEEDAVDRDSTSEDIDSEDADATAPLFDDTSRWMNERTCEGVVEYQDVDEAFSIPDRPSPTLNRVMTASEVASRTPDDAISYTMLAGEDLNPGSQPEYDLYSTGGDAKFYLYISNPQNADARDTYRTNLTVLVDYEPVDATITHWDDDREQKLAETVSSGLNVPNDSIVDIFDITIPASHFDEDRMYEVSISFTMSTLQHRPISRSQRFALYHDGYDRHSRPCAIPSLNEPADGTENQLFGRIGTNDTIIFTDDFAEIHDVDKLHTAEPGETKRFYATSFSFAYPIEKVQFYVPTLNGEPVGSGWYVKTPAREPPQRSFIDSRRSFEVTFPDEPGIYEVQVANWMDPLEILRTREGEEVDGIRASHLGANSNALRFRVQEPE